MLSNKDLFPKLDSDKFRKHPKNVHNEINIDKSQSEILLSCIKKNASVDVDTKTIPCSNILQGNECAYKHKCKYAHYKEEWEIKNCHHGVRCNRVTGEKCKNVDSNNVCFYLHPHEDEDAFMKRLKIDTSVFKKPSDEELNKSKHFTKMCDSYFLEVPCNKSKGECTYAHTIEQLVLNKCMFKESCNHVVISDDGAYSTSGVVVCMFLHPDETMDNYISRVLEPRRKIVIDSNTDLKTSDTSDKECISTSTETEKADTSSTDVREVSKSWADIVEDEEFNKLKIESQLKKSDKKVEKLSKKEIKEVKKQAKKDAKLVKEEAKVVKEPKKVHVVQPPVKESSTPQVFIEASEHDLSKILNIMVSSGVTNFKIKVANN